MAKSSIKNDTQLQEAEQAYYSGNEWNGKTGDEILTCIRAYKGMGYRKPDTSEGISTVNKATVKKMNPGNSY